MKTNEWRIAQRLDYKKGLAHNIHSLTQQTKAQTANKKKGKHKKREIKNGQFDESERDRMTDRKNKKNETRTKQIDATYTLNWCNNCSANRQQTRFSHSSERISVLNPICSGFCDKEINIYTNVQSKTLVQASFSALVFLSLCVCVLFVWFDVISPIRFVLVRPWNLFRFYIKSTNNAYTRAHFICCNIFKCEHKISFVSIFFSHR